MWMGPMPRWNALILLPPQHTYTQVLPQLGLPLTASTQRATWFFHDHKQARGTQIKYGERVVGSYDPFGDVVAISYKPSSSNPLPNFVCVDGKFKVSTRFVEPKWPWGAPTCDPQARSPLLIEQILECFFPEGWALVVQGLSAIVPELQESRARRNVVLEADPN